jgi:hypothetical protein
LPKAVGIVANDQLGHLILKQTLAGTTYWGYFTPVLLVAWTENL